LSRATDANYDLRGWSDGTSLKHKQVSRGVDADGETNNRFAKVFGGLSKGSGISVRSGADDLSSRGPQENTPKWMLDPDIFQKFLRGLVGKDCALEGQDLCYAAGLDYVILDAHYFRRKTDKEIYEEHAAEFKAEKQGRRHTSSTGAVKRRRLQLVKQGDAKYEPPKPAHELGANEKALIATWQGPVRTRRASKAVTGK
jgi:hypothetical protein